MLMCGDFLSPFQEERGKHMEDTMHSSMEQGGSNETNGTVGKALYFICTKM